jgi:hypothetical protein
MNNNIPVSVYLDWIIYKNIGSKRTLSKLLGHGVYSKYIPLKQTIDFRQLLNGSHNFFHIFSIYFFDCLIKNSQTTIALTFLTLTTLLQKGLSISYLYYICSCYIPPIAEILCVKNVRAIVVCGFLTKYLKEYML